MTKLTQKKVKFDWGDKQEVAFQIIKQKLCSASILALPKGSEDFVVYCDASIKGLGAILMQRQKVIAYGSQKLKFHEKNYTGVRGSSVRSEDLEHYLYGTKCTVFTDHKSLQHILDKKELNMRQRSWLELLSDYDCEIRYVLSWSRAFSEMDRRCVEFENGISESFNRAILLPRHKPIITMLEKIRIYIMQRLVAMNKLALNLEDTITPSIRKQLEILKVKQCGFQELKVKKGDESYGVNLMNKVCGCRMMLGRPQKERIKSAIEESTQVSRVGRRMTCRNCWEQGHNKDRCKNEARPQLEKVIRPIKRSIQPMRPACASRGGGRGSRGGRMGRGNEIINVNDDAKAGVGSGTTVGRGRGRRGGGRGKGRKGTSVFIETPTAGYSRVPLTDEQEHYLRDEEALREHLEEKARFE
nr:putative reverse transcriptase domain-containing protein [Tanacetum cinerariifolium]